MLSLDYSKAKTNYLGLIKFKSKSNRFDQFAKYILRMSEIYAPRYLETQNEMH
jgi:hypothetical protein